MQLENKLVSAIKWSALSKLFSQLINWGFTFLTIRLLTPDDYGLFAVIMASIALFTLINEFGLGAALIQAKTIDAIQIKSVNGFILGVNIFIFLIIQLLSSHLALFFSEPRLALLLQISAFQFLIGALAVIPRSLLTREINFKNKEIIFAMKGFINAISTYLFALQGYGVWSLIYGSLLSSLFATIALNLSIKRFYFPSLTLKPIKSLIGFSLNMLVQRVIWWSYTQADVFILKKLFISSIVGVFFTAKHLASMPQDKLTSIINEIVLTGFSKINHDPEKVRIQAIRLLSILSTLIFPIYYGIAATSDIIVPLLIGEQWITIIEPLFLLCLIYPLRMLNAPIAEVLNALGFPKINSLGLLINASIMLPSIIIGAQWGVIGVCYAWLIGYPLAFILFNLLAAKYTGLDVISIIKTLLPALLSSLLMLISINWIYTNVFNTVSFSALFICIFFGGIIYLSSIWVLNKSTCKEIISLIKK